MRRNLHGVRDRMVDVLVRGCSPASRSARRGEPHRPPFALRGDWGCAELQAARGDDDPRRMARMPGSASSGRRRLSAARRGRRKVTKLRRRTTTKPTGRAPDGAGRWAAARAPATARRPAAWAEGAEQREGPTTQSKAGGLGELTGKSLRFRVPASSARHTPLAGPAGPPHALKTLASLSNSTPALPARSVQLPLFSSPSLRLRRRLLLACAPCPGPSPCAVSQYPPRQEAAPGDA
ncbi:hypothetical protein GQ55_3G269100 [Panicum hallii var. hallii]|uniref:Uncharacterized protein n=1 Tax=Panicum hallii var. hallii TaxID=1504633 RepID=A0A2T7EDS5_9POAL|nr:hypothetical protein GQ55_3G269100 [Panicum hallii var. hallii]